MYEDTWNFEPKITLAAKVKHFREKRGISQRELADLTQLRTSFIMRIENVTHEEIAKQTVLTLANCLGCTYYQLVDTTTP